MKPRLVLFAAAVVMMFIFAPALADEVVTLKSGMQYEGRIISHTDRGFKIRTDDGDKAVPYKLIESVQTSSLKDDGAYKAIDDVLEAIDAIKQKKIKRQAENLAKIQDKRVDFYMTAWCPYCTKMKKFLNANGVQYTTYNIDFDAVAQKRFKELGGRGVPVVHVNDRVIYGYDTAALWRALIE